MKCRIRPGWIIAPAVLAFAGPVLAEEQYREVNIRVGSGNTIVGVRWDDAPSKVLAGDPPVSYPFPRPRLQGFSPRVAITTSDAALSVGLDDLYQHQLQSSYVGNALNPFVSPQFTIGYLDSGADAHVAAGTAADTLGLFGENLTSSTIELGGAAGTDVGYITMPVGWFAAGLSAVTAPNTLNYSALRGHSNVSGIAAPAIDCGGVEVVNALIGLPFLAFHQATILVESPRKVWVSGREYQGPEVILQPAGATPPVPSHPFTHSMLMELWSFGGLGLVTTANYYPTLDDLDGPPVIPTVLSFLPGSIPLGGAFYAEILVGEGELGPTNPAKTMFVLVDTGAQSSVITPAMVAALSLPFEPDFAVDVCGIGGVAPNIPGYFLDYVKIDAAGGALEFSQAPFVVLDITLGPGGTPLDGILGMNFFWNRNVRFAPNESDAVDPLTGGFLWLSDPIPFAYGDFDVDLLVDGRDAELFVACAGGPQVALGPDCEHTDGNGDLDLDLADFASFQLCYAGSSPADPNCGP